MFLKVHLKLASYSFELISLTTFYTGVIAKYVLCNAGGTQQQLFNTILGPKLFQTVKNGAKWVTNNI